MSTHPPVPQHDSPGREVVPTDRGGAVPVRFENPGLVPHRHRMADVDPKAAKRAERQVATLFGLSALGTLLALVAYFSIKFDTPMSFLEHLARTRLSTELIGVGLALGLFGIGAGAVHWAKTLMPDEERVEDRHLQRGSDEDRRDAVNILKEGSAEAGLGRRPLIRNSLLGALALFPLPAIALLRDTGPMPGNALSTTMWRAGLKLLKDPQGTPIKASDIRIGAVVHIVPEGINDVTDYLEEKAKAAVLVMRLDPKDLDPKSVPGSYEGIVAYSKICTHMGCPVALYEQQTHHLLCPCHQSTFDVTRNCEVIFGPAKRNLPQLAITVDADGYLVAKDGFREAVGPSFWERG
ncbi:MAG TPA: Rieske 2Fe-2S domain-containing protein [Kineosporiaceae bacterium]|jgi:ubiquinol-cytochrome c reductase iron-sulfur subunit|nr:Rieske 2Fe-2S domain-containing protein [Kineosporiaceae bacterium]